MIDKRFRGFQDIRAGQALLGKTKKRMDGPNAPRRRFPVKRTAVAACSLVLAGAAALAFLTGVPFGGHAVLAANAKDLMQGITAREVDVSHALTNDYIRSQQDFSARLFKNCYSANKNTLVSPASALFALGMTANGASGKTREEFLSVLGKYGLSLSGLNEGCKAWSDTLTRTKGGTTLKIANSIWSGMDFGASRRFLQTNADYYGAAARVLNFSDPKAADVMNGWISRNTNGKIPKLIDKTSPDDVMFLINAVYFNAKWKYAMQNSLTDDFTLSDGKKVSANYVSVTQKLSYMKSGGATATLLPYDDGAFSLLCILPDEGVSLSGYVRSMTDETIPALLKSKTDEVTAVRLPKLNVASDFVLNDSLKAMGLRSAFEPDAADFSALGKDARGVYISKVRQRAFLKVDEKGTEAAAATEVEMLKSAAVLPDARLFLNRPFLCAVVDDRTGLPLFLAAVNDPSQS